MLMKLKNLILKRKIICTNSVTKWNSSSRLIDYEIVPTTAKDTCRILGFFKTNYYPEEPFSKALGGVPSDGDIEEIMDTVQNGLSRMAIEKKTNKLLGVTLNQIYTKEMSDRLDLIIKESKNKNDTLIEFLKLTKKLEDESKFWERIGVNSCLRNAAICIDPKYRGMKIAYNLLKSVETVSNERYLRGESTEYASYNILLKLGWKNVWEMNFKDYKDENGRVIINTQPPNTHFRLLIFDTGKK